MMDIFHFFKKLFAGKEKKIQPAQKIYLDSIGKFEITDDEAYRDISHPELGVITVAFLISQNDVPGIATEKQIRTFHDAYNHIYSYQKAACEYLAQRLGDQEIWAKDRLQGLEILSLTILDDKEPEDFSIEFKHSNAPELFSAVQFKGGLPVDYYSYD